MPELPDVELYKRILDKTSLGKRIEHVVVSDRRILGKLSAKAFASHLEGARLVASRRHGKHLLAETDKGGWLTLHFGMTGALRFVGQGEEEPPFTRVSLAFSSGGRLAYTNKRMIGRVGFVHEADEFIAEEKLGPDALDASFDLAAFKAALAGTKRDVKSALMDQERMAGVGNIYADEILFQAGIDPRTRVDALEAKRFERLYATTRKVLESAIAHGAGAEQLTDRLPKGWFLPERRDGGRCPRCGGAVEMLKLGGRTSYFCARCQPQR